MDNKTNENFNVTLIDKVNIDLVQSTISRIEQFQEVLRATLQPGRDVGIVPGSKKPSLLKPGAEKMFMILGLTSRYEIIKSEDRPEDGFINYEIRCILSKDGKTITEGLGNCNSWENKYKNQNPYAVKNTLLKMAKKRAQVDAALTVGSLSDVFTQDIEEMDQDTLNNMHLDEKKHNQHNYQKQQKQQQKQQYDNNGRGPGDYEQNYTQPQQRQPQQQQRAQQQTQPSGNMPGLFPGQDPRKPITPGMGKRLYARSGYNESIVQQVIENWGYKTREEILLGDYDAMVAEAEQLAESYKRKQAALNSYS